MAISPFTLSPNPAWMYLTPTTLESIETIRWMIEDRQGLAAMFGEAGYGKSTLLRLLLSEYADESLYTTTLLTRVDLSPFAFAKKLSGDFGIEPQRSLAKQYDALEEFLFKEYEAGRTVIAFLDEAQRLTGELLEVIRGLLNFETDVHKLIQIVIAGQPDLLARIRLKRNAAIASRVFSPVILQSLSEAETAEMVAFRCERARVPNPFTPEAIRQIYRRVGGNPRRILWTCARAIKHFEPATIQPSQIDEIIDRTPLVQAATDAR